MRPSLWFVVPAHGRAQLASICLRQLRRTCDALDRHGVDATAVVIADGENLRDLRALLGKTLLGFATVERDNEFLSRKFNDGIQLACDRKYNPRPADFAVPCGSDDWVDHRLFVKLPPKDRVFCFQHMSFVREDGREMTSRFLNYTGGCGIRIYPRQVLVARSFRPADEDRKRACDTSILTNLRVAMPTLHVVHRPLDARQIVDWKSPETQLNPYDSLVMHRAHARTDPFVELEGIFPRESLEEMAAHYGRARDPVPA